MSAPQDDPIADTSPDDSRSGADIAEAIEVAEAGSRVEQVHDRGQFDKTGEAPVEQVRDDPEMTQGQVVHGSGSGSGSGSEEGTAEGGTEGVSSGAAQSVRGARPVDQT
ncbi:hypothetical protein ACI8AF_25820 [Blastococcus sp. SYSU D00669]